LPHEDFTNAVKSGCTIIAHNANFERTIWRHILTPRYGWPEPKLEQWRCTMTQALAMSLPASLENAASAVGLEARKDMDGHGTMIRMAKPRRPRKGELPNGVYWFDDEERRQKLYDYCKNDVMVERELAKRLLPLRPSEQRLWQLDQRINDRGVFVDTALCNAALKIVEKASAWLDDEMRQVTRGAVAACSNVGEITGWLRDNGLPGIDSIAKNVIEEMLAHRELPPAMKRVLELRREAAKASVAKIDALLEGKSEDGRARGLLQFHAAGPGRWGGRRFQPHNLKRPELDEDQIDDAIEAVASGSAEMVQMLYGEPLAVVGDCLRGMVKAVGRSSPPICPTSRGE
jgi:DNA polymerase